MHSRQHGSKPTIAFWMLVAVADLVILATTAAPVVLPVLGLLVILAAARLVTRRAGRTTEVAVRRRA